MDTGDAAWVLVSAALVLFMTPGLALFYGGMDQTRNVMNMLMMNFWCLLTIPIIWAVVGYSLTQSGDGSFIGNFDLAFLDGLSITGEDGGSALLTMVFLGMFAVITPALISGAVAGRIKFSAWAIFAPDHAVIGTTPDSQPIHATADIAQPIGVTVVVEQHHELGVAVWCRTTHPVRRDRTTRILHHMRAASADG